MADNLTLEDVARAWQAANPGTTMDQALQWARSEVKRQVARQQEVAGNGAAPAEVVAEPEPQPKPKPTPGWKFPMYEAADVLMGVDNGSIEPIEGLQAAVVLLMAAAAKLP